MNITQQGIITLLKSAVTRQTLSLPEGFSLEEALPLIRSHNIVTMAYDGAVRCGISPKDPLMQKLFAAYCKATIVSEGQRKELGRIREAFDRERIDYMLLKGSRMKDLYPLPELRTMGDADILIRTEQYDRIRPLMESLGFEEKEESDHELVWRSKGLYLELHKRLIPSYNRDFYAYYGSGWELAKDCCGTSYSMTPEDEWIYLFTHFAKHYRDGGIGLRHVTDLWIWRRRNPSMDEKYIETVLKKLGLLEFHGNILRLLELWFENGSSDVVLDVITEFIFSSGSFGDAEMKALSLAVRGSKHGAAGMSSRMLYLRELVFPDAEALQGKYKVLKKAPWMLPAVWVARPFYKVLFERKSVTRKLESMESLTKEKIDLRKEMLNCVGLDYNF